MPFLVIRGIRVASRYSTQTKLALPYQKALFYRRGECSGQKEGVAERNMYEQLRLLVR